MLTIIFAIAAIFCGFKWLLQYVNTLALSMYIAEKGTQPTDKEMAECCTKVWKHLLHIR